MKDKRPDNEQGFERDDQDQALWDLLGRASKPGPSPFFTRNVLREIRNQPQRRGIFALFGTWTAGNLRRGVLALSAATALVLAMGSLGWLPFFNEGIGGVALAESAESTEKTDYEVIVNLDELLAYQETSVWLDSE